MKFDHRTALITGAASGISRAAAQSFAQGGARVLLADIDETRGAEAAAELRIADAPSPFEPGGPRADPVPEKGQVEVRLELDHLSGGHSFEDNVVRELDADYIFFGVAGY